MKVLETVEMLATPFFDYVQILKGLHHCLRLQPREQQGTGEYRKEVNDRERERERESTGRGGVLGQALAQSSSFFLCAADKQNKMRARKNFRGRHLCFHI